MERRAVTRVAMLVGALVGSAAIVLGYLRWSGWRGVGPGTAGAHGVLGMEHAGSGSPRAPDSVRIRAEVLNASTVPGLARRAAMRLRDLGFDVVYTGTSAARYDSVLVVDRSGHPDWARLAVRAMGGGRWEARPDTSRYLDVTVLVGAAWHPPAEPFYP
jgi:hypothetical protein